MVRTVKRGLLLPDKPARMINRPTVMPATGVGGQGLPALETDPFFSLEVDTTGATEAEEVILFDGGRGYQLGFNTTNGANVKIKGLTADYQFILNDVVHNASFFSQIKFHVVPSAGQSLEAISLVQYSHPLHVYSSSKGSKPRLLRTIHPSMGVNEQQYHFNINTFSAPLLIDNRVAIVYKQEANVRMVWSFYQQAELNRVQ